MSYHRSILTPVCLLVLPFVAPAQQAAAPQPNPPTVPTAPPTEAELLIDRAVKKLQALNTVSADLLQTVDLLGQKFQVQGRYLKAPGNKFWLELKLQGLPGAKGTMLQVCDGVTLGDYTEVLDSASFRKFQIAKVLEKLNAPEVDAEMRDNAIAGLGLSGPDTLLTGLRRAFVFDQKSEDTIDGKAVWVLRGKWKDYDGLTGPGQPRFSETLPLPSYVPALAALSLGKEDGWPYRLELSGKATTILVDDRPRGPDGKPLGVKLPPRKEDPSKVVMVYSNVALNQPLPDENFAFTPPPNVQVFDGTEQILASLDANLAARAEAKKAGASKDGEGTLPQGIQVTPSPESPAPSTTPETFRSTTPPPTP